MLVNLLEFALLLLHSIKLTFCLSQSLFQVFDVIRLISNQQILVESFQMQPLNFLDNSLCIRGRDCLRLLLFLSFELHLHFLNKLDTILAVVLLVEGFLVTARITVLP